MKNEWVNWAIICCIWFFSVGIQDLDGLKIKNWKKWHAARKSFTVNALVCFHSNPFGGNLHEYKRYKHWKPQFQDNWMHPNFRCKYFHIFGGDLTFITQTKIIDIMNDVKNELTLSIRIADSCAITNRPSLLTSPSKLSEMYRRSFWLFLFSWCCFVYIDIDSCQT